MKQLYTTLWIIFASFIAVKSFSQTPTVGLLFSNPNVTDGYMLFTPEQSNNVYLINTCGEKVNEWTFSEYPGSTCYLLENGNLLRAGKDSLEIRDWDNNLIWSYAMNLNGLLQHHDIEPLPNGNILCLITDNYTLSDIVNQGRDPLTVSGSFKLDKIIELQPIGTNDANIVWEWKFFDHFVQDFDNTKPNYGVVVDSPELIDLNFDNGYPSDWTHLNAIDYNANLDQIIISSRHLSELYIIDHSTTITEAASHAGGNSGMGGDILWRWGNPQVYRQGNTSDQTLFLQHDAKWVESGYLDENKITVFSNQDGGNTYSSVHIITPQINNNTYLMSNNKFLPLIAEWSWTGIILGNTFYESKKSGVQSLPNGNLLICETGKGQATEITKNGNILWVYRNSVAATIYNQYETPANNGIFRAEKYPLNYIGFTGKDVTPFGTIENLNPITDTCNLSTQIISDKTNKLKIINPIRNHTINFNTIVSFDQLTIADINGKIVFKQESFKGQYLPLNLNSGLYILQILSQNKTQRHKIIIE